MSQKVGYSDGHINVWLLTPMLKHSGENSHSVRTVSKLCLISHKPAQRKDCHCRVCEKERIRRRECARALKARDPSVRKRLAANSMRYRRANPERRRMIDHKNYASRRKRQISLKQQLLNVVGGKCCLCEFVPRTLSQMDLHETNGTICMSKTLKPIEPGHALRDPIHTQTLFRRAGEIVPLCRNCHALVHDKETRPEMLARIELWQSENVNRNRHLHSGSEPQSLEQSNTSVLVCL